MTSDPLQLERHTAFAARLARGLVADENAAADLVQASRRRRTGAAQNLPGGDRQHTQQREDQDRGVALRHGVGSAGRGEDRLAVIMASFVSVRPRQRAELAPVPRTASEKHSGVISPSASVHARRISFCSSRTLPGQP